MKRYAKDGIDVPARYERCVVCGREWNVSRMLILPRNGYKCPLCSVGLKCSNIGKRKRSYGEF